VYPGLLDSSRPQKVEIFVPFSHKLVTSDPLFEVKEDVFDDSGEYPIATPSQQVAMASPIIEEDRAAKSAPIIEGEQASRGGNQRVLSHSLPRDAKLSVRKPKPPSVTSHSVSTLPSDVITSHSLAGNGSRRIGRNTSSSSSGHIADLFRRLGEGSHSPLLDVTPPCGRSPPLSSSRGAMLSEHSWEVISKYSSTSNRLSILQDQSDPDYDLVPLWECLQVGHVTYGWMMVLWIT
jgi:hypothetical protein